METNQNTLALGDILHGLSVVDLTLEGGAVARHEGRVLFLDKGIPGDVVSVRVHTIKKRLVFADVIEITTPSPDTQEPWCPHFSLCGACTNQHYAEEAVQQWKMRHVKETLQRIGGVEECQFLPIITSPAQRAYRNKMAYAFGVDETGEAVLGLRMRKQHAIVPVTHCAMQHPVAMDILQAIREQVAQLHIPITQEIGRTDYLRFIVIHTPQYKPRNKQQIFVECITGDVTEKAKRKPFADAIEQMGKALMEQFSLTGFIHSERSHVAHLAQGERVLQTLGAVSYEEQFGDKVFSVPHNAFLQTNTGAATLLYTCLKEEAHLTGTECLWDIYCGIGTISLFLAPHVAESHGFDIQKDAIHAANSNRKKLGYTHCHFHAGKLSDTLFKTHTPPDVVIVDPPRAGIEKKVVDKLKTLSAHKILYVSCDVGTQARDIQLLAPEWVVDKAIPVDMFPHTPHVENIVVLKRA